MNLLIIVLSWTKLVFPTLIGICNGLSKDGKNYNFIFDSFEVWGKAPLKSFQPSFDKQKFWEVVRPWSLGLVYFSKRVGLFSEVGHAPEEYPENDPRGIHSRNVIVPQLYASFAFEACIKWTPLWLSTWKTASHTHAFDHKPWTPLWLSTWKAAV